MISLRKVWTVAERDIKMFLRYKFLLIMRAIWFVAQIALFGLVVNHMFRKMSKKLWEEATSTITRLG
jgi:hypothetical protein